MEDLKAGSLEALARKIPGFSGYLDRERRRDADKLQRETLAKEVTALKSKVQDLQEELLGKGDMKGMSRLGELNKKLDRVEARLRHASYGFSGFFEQNQVGIDELNRIYEYDLSLFTFVENAERAVAAHDAGELENQVNALDARLDERERLLKGVS